MDSLFGSETRGRVLEQLVQNPLPQTAYRIAKAVGAEPIQVLKILKSLTPLTEHSVEGWILTDESLRRFLRNRSAHREDEIRREKDVLLVRYGMKPNVDHGRR